MRRFALVVLVGSACADPATDTGVDTDGDTTDTDPVVDTDTDTGDRVIDQGPISLPDLCDDGRTFCDQAEAMGLYVHGPGWSTGGTWVDLDGDGWDDLVYNESGQFFPGFTRRTSLFLNQRDGTFVDAGVVLPDERQQSTFATLAADVDGDGDADLLLVNGGYDAEASLGLFLNRLDEGRGFEDVTETSGLDLSLRRWWGGAMADVDLDGDVDLALTALADDVGFPPFDIPDPPRPAVLQVYLNAGDGTFVDQTATWSLPVPDPDVKNPSFLDADGDGDADLFVANNGATLLLRNDLSVDGGFVDVSDAVIPGVRGVFVSLVEDFDQDGRDDLYLGREELIDQLLIAQEDGSFEVVDEEASLRVPPRDGGPLRNTLTAGVGDLNGDGWPDILVGSSLPQAAGDPIVWCHAGRGLSFVDCSADFVAGHGDSYMHAPSLGDPDHDGDLDVFWALGGSPINDQFRGFDTPDQSALYIQHRSTPARTATVRLVGSTGNTSALGARVRVVGSEVHHYAVRGLQGWGSQNTSDVLVALGTAATGAVTVTWPGGATSEVTVSVGDRVTVRQP